MISALAEIVSIDLAEREVEGRFELSRGDFLILMAVKVVCERSRFFCKADELAALKGGLNRTALFASLRKLTEMGLLEKVIKGQRFKKGAITRYYPSQTGWKYIREMESKQSDYYLGIREALYKGDYDKLVKVHQVKIVSMFGTPRLPHYMFR